MKRPLPVTIIACLYIAVGSVGFAAHFAQLFGSSSDAILVEITEALALLAGVFLLRGQNLARWLAVAWMAFHVALSAFHPIRELMMHCVFFAVIVWCLFRMDSARYFRRPQREST